MARRWLGSTGVIVWVLGCGLNTGGLGEGSGASPVSGSDSSTSAATNTNADADADTTASSNGSVDGTGSTDATDNGSGSTSSSGGPVVTTDPDPTTSGTTSTSESSSSGEPPPPVDDYPACMTVEDCPDPYTLCWPPMEWGLPTESFCTRTCMNAAECPVPASGTATPVCQDLMFVDDVCLLDCSRGDCPDEMTCVDVFNDGSYERCARQ